MKRICHITTVHRRYDTRIFLKECISLSKEYEVHLIVADGLGDEVKNNVHIHDIGLRQQSVLKRAYLDSRKAYKKALSLNCCLYHFHDPELTYIGVKLKRKGFYVIYDVHEDLPKQILSKTYLKKWMKPLFSKLIKFREEKTSTKFNYIITATDFINNRFLSVNKNSISIKNYPILDELFNNVSWSDKNDEICYVGGLTEVRGVFEVIESLQISNVKFNLGGPFMTNDYKDKCMNSKGWNNVNYYGYLDRESVKTVYEKSKIGIVTLYPIINYIDALPVKLFEYMAAGIPVISSDIKLWRSIVEKNNCGLLVNPKSPKEIDNAIQTLLSDNKLAEEMGRNGKKAVEEIYNWNVEEKKLLNVYKEILS